jgi:hypothetical protein
MRRLLRPLWVLIAVVFLVEAWLWHRLSALLGRLLAAIGLPRLKARLACWVERLPPPAALLLFVVPAICLLPLKLAGLWMLAHGHWLGALGVLGAAKLAGVGVTAFIFQAARPRLLQMAWFAWAHGRVLAALGWAHRQLDPFKERVRVWARGTVAPLVARLRAALPRGRVGRRVLRLWRRARRARSASVLDG